MYNNEGSTKDIMDALMKDYALCQIENALLKRKITELEGMYASFSGLPVERAVRHDVYPGPKADDFFRRVVAILNGVWSV